MAKRGRKKEADQKAVYQRYNEQQQIYTRERSQAGRDIGPIPPVLDQPRRDSCAESLERFCRSYFPEVFYFAWSPDQERVLQRAETAARSGGLFAYAMPRGGGKSSIAEAGALWSLLYGYQEFIVIIGAEQDSALETLESVKTGLERNERLFEDFPEVCFPIRKLDGISHRATGQLCEGQRTYIGWTSQEIVLPTIPGSVASSGLLRVTGITGRIRGMKFKRPSDGRIVRPGLVIPDDPQTRESARSPAQCQTRIQTLRGDVLGLAGPGRKISVLMPCTVIRPGDVADVLTNRKEHPQWQGERTRMVYEWATNVPLWEQYRAIRKAGLEAGDGGRSATEFYKANRAAMDEGAVVAWPDRHNPDELSAIQNAMNLRYDVGDEAFFAEYQNDPLPDVTPDPEALTAEQIAGKVNGRERGEVPNGVTRVVAFIDVQKPLLPWVCCGFEDDFTGYVLDYGTWPDQQRAYFQRRDAKRTIQLLARETEPAVALSGLEAQIRWALDSLAASLLTRGFPRDDGAVMKVERCLVDANWGESTDVVYQWCRESPHAAVLLPSHGKYVGAASIPFGEYKRKKGDRVGLNWRMPNVQGRRVVRYAVFDSNFWKSFVHARLSVPVGGTACLSLFGPDAERHKLFAEHLTAETAVRTEGRGRTVMEWKPNPLRMDNDWFDCAVGCCVAASIQGAALAETARVMRPATGKAPLKLSELQKNRRQHAAPLRR